MAPPRYFTPQQLQQWAQDEPARLLEAGLIQISRLQQRSAQLKAARAQIKLKDERIAQLEAQLAEAQRASLRQAAPFRLVPEKRSSTPKRPGRPAGYPGSCRPRPAQIDEEIQVELSACEHCGCQQWKEPREIEQFIEEIPVQRPRVTRLRTYEATCSRCGEIATSRHPLQVSTATGAAAAHLGPRALAIAADLNKAKGLPMRKTCAVLRDHFGLSLSPGGLSQALTRVAHRAEPQYHQLQEQLHQVPAVHIDETSWWLGGVFHWLWVFTHPGGTFYWIDPRRNRAVVEHILGVNFAGILVSDCLSTYDFDHGVQQKCYAHHLKAIRHAKDIHPKQGEGFLCQIGACLKTALALGKRKAAGACANFPSELKALETNVDLLLAIPCSEPSEEAVRQRLLKQRDHLFTFLLHDGVDPTNNLAERQLRPAVIARKISCGNKTTSGAHTFQILCSLAATCTQSGSSFIDLIAAAACLNSG